MSKTKQILSVLLMCGVISMAAGCASEQAEQTSNNVTNATAQPVGSVLGAVGDVIMFPFHLVGALFS
jgi:hypothetical protein